VGGRPGTARAAGSLRTGRRSHYAVVVEQDVRAQKASARFNSIVEELRILRESRGVTYRELAARITRQREENGLAPATARIAHTTVADVFRPGRARLNAQLVAEIVRALDGDADTAEEWRARVAQAARLVPESRPTPDAIGASAFIIPSVHRTTPALIVALVTGGLLLNATGKFFNPLLGDVFFVDMVGTAVVALIGGPWLAALVGVLFVVVELLKFQVGGALFAVTMIFAGLIWGYGVRRGWGNTLPRFLAVSAVVAIATSAVAVPITMLYYNGHVDRGLDVLFAHLQEGGLGPWLAVSGTNLTVSLVDKVVTGAIAFLIARLIRALPRVAEQVFTPLR